ncbi:hypothetical protein [Bordetella bronchialis]|uniref:Uncharacterized protein n=1 Tax=Bordetella bronchialis TaxID=463025 RepID=A0A193G1U3_9BORD|nr:hypothetical protein [Bordetella bronchialis]ANN68675.1 hypothetical protein BAU06_22325 [Bordetella bronchialis]ANN73815.1 hypothetical protein BAU08_22855 [Bordetella bronchialis]
MTDSDFAPLAADARILSELVRLIAGQQPDPETFIAQMKVDVLAWLDQHRPQWPADARAAYEARVDDVLGAAQNRSVGG